MKSRLLAASLLFIFAFALADLVRAGTSALASYLAGSAAEDIARSAPAGEGAWKTASGN